VLQGLSRARPSALNVVQRVGGSVGTALLAVVLQHQIREQLAGAGAAAPGGGGGVLQRMPDDVRARIADPLATAFGNTFWWAVGVSAVALIPAAILAVSQRRDRRARTLAGAEGAAG
jgi:hypothetical protein